ncbi:MAG: rhomboid family intramembrane serine protease [Euryarchaeota archaeon]|nr:rhomboid family intramembrane serine protease [Euryarchaeota archaeon]
MVSGSCHLCGREEYLPFECRFCNRAFCVNHRLPESHQCAALSQYRESARSSGQFFQPEWRSPVARGPSVASRVRTFTRGSMNKKLLLTLVVVYLAEWAVLFYSGDPRVVLALFGLNVGTVQSAPWTLLTSIVSHDPYNPFHLLFNSLFLYFFGPYLEREIGPARFLGFFIVCGLVAGVAQSLLFPGTVLGASGALMGVLGAVTILYPNLTVIFIIFPMPLYAMTAIFAVLDIFGLGDGTKIAHLAHLAGLAAGVAYGYDLKARLVRRRSGVEILHRRH